MDLFPGRIFRAFAVAVTSFLFFCMYAAGQSDSAMLTGRVVDSSDLNITGARVELINIDRGSSSVATTGSTGLYLFPSVPPGRYVIKVSANGFMTVNATNVTLNIQDSLQENFKLAVGSVSETITVEAVGNIVDVSTAVSTNVGRDLIGELPLNGRSFQTLFQLTPGAVITNTNGRELGQFSINGQRANSNYFTVDGVSANVAAFPGTGPGQAAGGSVPALSASGGTSGLVSVDALEEFSIQTSGFAPEYGRTPGGQVSMLTRSGTNAFHGDAFDYLRNDAAEANDWFANHNQLRRPALRQNDFGGVLGGPLMKNRTFFFASYEGLRLIQPFTGISDVPDLAIRQTAIPAMQPFINAFPLPNGDEEGNGLASANYATSNPSRLNAASIRIDDQLHSGLSWFARYDRSTSEAETVGRLQSFSLNSVEHLAFKLHTATAGLSWSIRPTLNNDLRFNWSWSAVSDFNTLTAFQGAVPFSLSSALPPQTVDSGFLEVVIVNSNNAALERGPFNKQNLQRQVNVVDSLAWQHRNHLLKVGVDYRRLTPQVDPVRYIQGVFFDTAADFAAGNPNDGVEVIGDFGPIEAQYANYSLFFQDSWKATTRLTFVYGLRWDYNPPPTAHGENGLPLLHVEGIADLANASPAQPGSPLYHAPKDNVAPRFGFSYNVRDSSDYSSVLRAGFGTFYDLGTGPTGFIYSFAPFRSIKFPNATSFPLTPADAAKPNPSLAPPFGVLFAFPRTLRQPYTYHWNLSLEQSMTPRQSLTISYVGAAAHSLLREDAIAGAQLTPNIQELFYVSNTAYSNYNALQAQFRRQQTKRLQILGSYTWSHSLDNGSGDAAVMAPTLNLLPSGDYGNSDFDIRHTGSVALDYQPVVRKQSPLLRAIVGGWGLNTFLIARTAPPVNVTITRDLGFTPQAYRPDSVAGVPQYIIDPTAPGGRLLNPAAFNAPTAARQGDLRRNSVRGFSLFQQDFSIRRTFKIREGLSLQARVEAFNVLNHPNFASPRSGLGSVNGQGAFTPNAGFGISTSMFNVGSSSFGGGSGFNPLYQVGGPRSLQAGLKVEF